MIYLFIQLYYPVIFITTIPDPPAPPVLADPPPPPVLDSPASPTKLPDAPFPPPPLCV